MNHDPDIPLPSVETPGRVAKYQQSVTTPKSDRSHVGGAWTTLPVSLPPAVSSTTNDRRLDSSPSRSPLKSTRARPATPTSPSTSRSPSVTSTRHDRSNTPRLDKKRSAPNLNMRTPTTTTPFRRASSNLNPATPVRAKTMERPHMTPASVAQDYFRKELHTHSTIASEVVVFTHDACYGHRYSRPRATKATLGSIVERPERILATMLGATTAYVRLGERHKDGAHEPHPDKTPGPVPFALIKTSRYVPLNHPAVVAVHGSKWMDSLQLMCDTAEAKLAMGQKELTRPIGHTRDSKGVALPPLHAGDLYLSSESSAALQGCLGGVCDAVDAVYRQDSAARRAFVCIRPPGHHCSAEMPSGFCWLNNVHVGIAYAAVNHGLTHAAIIDFDLHHGDGSQAITWSHNREALTTHTQKNTSAYRKTPIGYYSLHDINSYPCEDGDDDKVLNASTCIHTAHGQSIWNVHLEPWNSPTEFLDLYETKYKILLDKARSFLSIHAGSLRKSGIQPRGAIFLSSGFDASEHETPGMQRHGVNVPTDFYARFTSDIVQLSQEPDLGVDGRVVSVLEGGYSDRALTSGVLSHICGLSQPVQRSRPSASSPDLVDTAVDLNRSRTTVYDPAWWHQSQLEMLEAIIAGNIPQPTVSKEKQANSFTSPTHASTAKMTEGAKERKSIFAQLEARLAFENAPPEPVPEVDWATAAYELSQLLVPTDRTTASCSHEELNAEQSRVRRDRLSTNTIAVVDSIEDKMQLRDRKAKQANAAEMPSGAVSKAANRRITIAAASELPDPTLQISSRTRRRSSAGSSVISSMLDLHLNDSETAQNTRAASRFSTVPPTKREAPAPLKKTRAPTKKNASATSSPRKSKKPLAAPMPSAPVEGQVLSVAGPMGDNSLPRTDAMDELTSGMKKISIKLKMPTPEQHVANQRRIAGAGSTASRAPRKPPIPKISRARSTGTQKPTTVSRASSDDAQGLSKAIDETPTLETTSDSSHVASTKTQEAIQYAKSSPTTMLTTGVGSSVTIDAAQLGKADIALHDRMAPVVESFTLKKENEDIVYPTIKFESRSLSPPLEGEGGTETGQM